MDRRCIFCMEELEEQGRCPSCGKTQWEYEWKKSYLAPYTMLKEKYLIGAVLGTGSFGITYMGFDTVLKQKVAVKEFFPERMVSRAEDGGQILIPKEQEEVFERGRQTFKEEASLIFGAFDMPGICNVKDYFEENETAYIVEEYLSGGTLKSYLQTQSGHGISWEECRQLFAPVLEGLCHIHSMGIVHRDMSPDNLMFDGEQHLKIIDFGAAKQLLELEIEENVALKESYAPPEQYKAGESIGPWSDVYAVCAVMYQALSGEKPISSAKRIHKDTLLPVTQYVALPEAVEEAIMQGMSLDIQKRYFYAGNLMEKLGMDTGSSQVLMGKIRSVWGEEWLKVVTEKNTDLAKRTKKQLTGRQKRRIGKIVAGVLVVLLCFAGGAKYYVEKNPEKIFKLKVEQAEKEAKKTPATHVIDEATEEYKLIEAGLDSFEKEESSSEEYQVYSVPASYVQENHLISNTYYKFYLTEDLQADISRYYMGHQLELSGSTYYGTIIMSMEEKKKATVRAYYTDTYNYTLKDGTGMSYQISYDAADRRVLGIQLDGTQEVITTFLQKIFPYMVPETYLTNEEIDGLFEQLDESEDATVRITNHAKYRLDLTNSKTEKNPEKRSLSIDAAGEFMA